MLPCDSSNSRDVLLAQNQTHHPECPDKRKRKGLRTWCERSAGYCWSNHRLIGIHKLAHAQPSTNSQKCLETELPKHKFSSANLKCFIEPSSEPQPTASVKSLRGFGFNSQPQQPQEVLAISHIRHTCPSTYPEAAALELCPSPVCLLSCPTPLLWGSAYTNHVAAFYCGMLTPNSPIWQIHYTQHGKLVTISKATPPKVINILFINIHLL